MSDDMAGGTGATAGASGPGERAYGELDRAGERLGHMIGGIIVGAKRLMAAPRASGSGAGASAAGPSALTRAERLVDSAGSRLGAYAQIGRWQLQRGLARAREEAEDIRAEAEAVRRRNSSPMSSGAPAPEREADVSGGAGVERAD